MTSLRDTSEDDDDDEDEHMSLEDMTACPKLFLPMSVFEKCDAIQKECNKVRP